jgi:uncharacterized membrane protein
MHGLRARAERVQFRMAHQPKLLVERSRAERIMQVAAIGGVVTLLAYAVYIWPHLPATVPTHFGIAGQPDAWGSRASLLALPIMTVVFFLALTLLERIPERYNYPIEVTAANAARVYVLGRRLVLSVKLILVLAFGLIFRTSADVALGKTTGLPGWFLPALLGSTAGVIVVSLVRMSRSRAELRG